MSRSPENGKKHFRREQFVVDRRLQFGIAFIACGILLIVSLFYFIGVYVLTDRDALLQQDTTELFGRLTRVMGVYVFLALGLVFTSLALFTHRIAGAATVIRLAIQGIGEGDFSRRLTLRRRDFLKDVAQELSEVRDELQREQARRRELIQALQQSLSDGDHSAAGDFADRLSQIEGAAAAPAEEPLTVG